MVTYGSLSWAYDRVGNRLSESRQPKGATTAVLDTYASGAANNRLTTVSRGGVARRTFGYDAAGNQVSEQRGSVAHAHRIDAAGRIDRVSVGGQVRGAYVYDGRNRLAVRRVSNVSPAGTTHLIHDAWDRILVETNGAGTSLREYVWLGDTPVAVLDGTATPATPTLLWVHVDHIERPWALTNASRTVVWRAAYEPFGAVASLTGPATLDMRFPGQWFQLESGLAYNWHRHYDATLGRYTQPEPLGLIDGPGVYGYAGQSPAIYTDPDGRCPWCIVGAATFLSAVLWPEPANAPGPQDKLVEPDPLGPLIAGASAAAAAAASPALILPSYCFVRGFIPKALAIDRCVPTRAFRWM